MKAQAGKVITVFSCKGGVGKTTMITNLAGIYSLMDKKVLIIDFDLNSGGVATTLKVDQEKDVYNLVDDISNNRFTTIGDYISKYNEKIDVLAAPKDPRMALKVDSKYVDIIINSCIYKYDIILVDTTHFLNPVSISALDISDNILFMITNDLVDIKNAKSMVSILNDNEKDNYIVVYNGSRDTGKDYYSLFDIKSMIRHNIDYTIDKSFYIRDIDKYVLDGKILTLNNKIRILKKVDIMKLTKIAIALIEPPKKKEVKANLVKEVE